MWRDPLDELIEELERAVPAARAPTRGADIPGKFFEEAERIDRESELERQQERRALQEGTELKAPPSTLASAPAIRLTPPARRLDPSAPTWDYSGQTDSDDTED